MKIKVLNFNKTEIEIAKSMSVYQNKNVNINGMIKAVKKGHLSVLESAVIEIELIDIPIFVRDHITRHRHFNFQCRTLRKPADELNFHKLDNHILANDILDVYYNYTKELYNLLQSSFDLTAEQARIVLPLATLTNCIMTGNLRSWIEFIQKRYCKFAQEETRELAKMIYKALEKLYPNIIKIFDNVCYNNTKRLCDECIRNKDKNKKKAIIFKTKQKRLF